MNSKIIGIGSYVPGAPITNSQLKELANIDFDAEKLENKLGIKQRHAAKLSAVDESCADFATKATMNAIANAKLDPKEIDLFIVATDTPEYISPSTAMIVQGRIQEGEHACAAFDLNASCASFAKAYDIAAKMIKYDPQIKHAVVTGVYNMCAHVRSQDPFGHTIFADGAGAFVLSKEDSEQSDYQCGYHLTDGTQWNYVGIYTGGTKTPFTPELYQQGEYGLQLLQQLPGDRNVRLWPLILESLLKRAQVEQDQVDHFIFTQINRHVITQVMEILGRPMSDTTCVMDRYGYTGSACLPMAFEAAVKSGNIKRGDRVALIASGAGLAVGANLFRY